MPRGRSKGAPAPTAEEWVCSHCGKDNWVSRHECRFCGLKKTKQGKPKRDVPGPGSSASTAGPAKLALREKQETKVTPKPGAKEAVGTESSSSMDPEVGPDNPRIQSAHPRCFKKKLQKIDGALAALGDMGLSDPVAVALHTQKEQSKEALNMKKSVGTRVDWALRQEFKTREAVNSLEEEIESAILQIEQLRDKRVAAKKEAEEAHNHVVAIKADVAADPELEAKDAAVNQDVVGRLAYNNVTELSRYPILAPGTEQVRLWIRAKPHGPEQPIHEGIVAMDSRRECKDSSTGVRSRASK